MATYEETLPAYIAAWSEVDEGKRRALLEKSWQESGIYTDPLGQASGREALIRHIGRFLRRYPGHGVLLTSGVNEHHGQLRFTWAIVGPDGKRAIEGIDFGEVGEDGRLLRITGFFGELPPISAKKE